MVATTVCIPTHSWRGFPFIHVLPTPALSCAFDDSHSDRREVISHCSLDLHFPDDGWWWTSFHGAVGHQYFFFGEMSVHVFCLSFNRFLFLGCWVVSVLNVLDTIPVLGMIFANIFSLCVGCLIILTFSLFFCCVETFYLALFPIVCFCFRFLSSGDSLEKCWHAPCQEVTACPLVGCVWFLVSHWGLETVLCVCVYGVQKQSNFILLCVAVRFSQRHLL